MRRKKVPFILCLEFVAGRAETLHVVDDLEQVLAVLVLEHWLSELAHVLLVDPALAVGNSLKAPNLQALPLLENLDVGRGLGERVERPCVEPRKAAAQRLHLQLAVLQETLVNGRNLVLATGTGLDVSRNIDNLVGIEVEAHDGVVALGLHGLLLDGETIALLVELRHAIALRIVNPVAEDGGLTLLLCCAYCLLKHSLEAVALEDVVAQDKAGAVVANEVGADGEGLRQPVGRWLLSIGEVHAVVAAVAQQALEAGQVEWRGDDENVADARQHEHANGIINHGLVVDRHKLLADALRDGIEPGAGAAGQNNSFHCISFLYYFTSLNI